MTLQTSCGAPNGARFAKIADRTVSPGNSTLRITRTSRRTRNRRKKDRGFGMSWCAYLADVVGVHFDVRKIRGPSAK